MNCSRCGSEVPPDANFCPSCGTSLDTPTVADDTTASLDLGVLDPHHEFVDAPELPAGIGMLVVVRGPNAGSRFLLDRDRTTVGRHPDSDIFLDDVTVSRRHAELVRLADGITLRDEGSLNGSYVNGERVEDRLLATNDEVQIGRFKLLFIGPANEAGVA